MFVQYSILILENIICVGDRAKKLRRNRSRRAKWGRPRLIRNTCKHLLREEYAENDAELLRTRSGERRDLWSLAWNQSGNAKCLVYNVLKTPQNFNKQSINFISFLRARETQTTFCGSFAAVKKHITLVLWSLPLLQNESIESLRPWSLIYDAS